MMYVNKLMKEKKIIKKKDDDDDEQNSIIDVRTQGEIPYTYINK